MHARGFQRPVLVGGAANSATQYLIRSFKRPHTCFAEQRNVLGGGLPDGVEVDLVVIVAQRVAEAAVDVGRYFGRDARHQLITRSNCCLGDPCDTALNRV